jgi:hypothetical protein
MRPPIGLLSLSLGLAACQGHIESELVATTQKATPSGNTIAAAVRQVAAEAKLGEPWETTALRPSYSPVFGDWIICVREASPPKLPAYAYAIFFDSDYKRARMAVGVDECYTHPYAPFPK